MGYLKQAGVRLARRFVPRLVDAIGTVAWDRPDDDYFGLSLADIGKALEA